MNTTCVIQIMKVASLVSVKNENCVLSECDKCKTSNLNLEDFDGDENENLENCSDSSDNGNSAKICF